MTGSHEVRGSIPLGSTNHFYILLHTFHFESAILVDRKTKSLESMTTNRRNFL